jgi:beta-xylosidase
MYIQKIEFTQNFFSFFFSTRWQKIEEMHDIKDHRFKVIKDGTKKPLKPEIDDDDDNDEEDLEKELQSMYNWRQKRS